MKRTLLAAILATAAIAFSCSMEEPAQDNSVVMNPTATIANFVFDGPATKTTASFEGDVASFAFAATDVMRAYALPDGDGLRFTVKKTKGTACVFEGEGFGLEAGTSYVAYYPGDSETVPELTAVPVDFSAQSQPAASEWNLSDVDFLYATGIEPVNGACNFSMKHLGALLITDVTFQQGGVFKSLVLRSSANFPVSGTVDLTANKVEMTPTAESNKITLALGGENGMEVAAGETITFYMMVPPVDMSNATLTLRLNDADGNTVLTKDGPGINFEAGKAVEFGTTPVINLSAKGTANTYIVSEAGNYCFNCTVAGNGQVPLPAGILGAVGYSAAYPTSGAAAPAFDCGGVRVILNQNNCIKDVALADGKIYFTATGVEGNAKVQLRDSANDDGVWTWLIWCTDKPADVALANGYTILDRNLGAITTEAGDTEEVYGLYYMFGDPIGYTADNFVNAGSDNAAMIWELAHTPNQPLVGDGCWFNIWGATNNPRQVGAFLWGAWGTGAGATWGETFDKQPGTASHKTLYDPCPVGYKVMAYDVLSEGNISGDVSGVYVPAAEGTVYFPYNGIVHKGGYVYTWAFHGPYDPSEPDGYAWYAAVWTSAHNNANMAWFKCAYAKGDNRGYLDALSDSIMSRGMAVRCMKQ